MACRTLRTCVGPSGSPEVLVNTSKNIQKLRGLCMACRSPGVFVNTWKSILKLWKHFMNSRK